MAGRILIADDVATNRIVLKVKLSAARYRVGQCSTAAEALRLIRADAADLLIVPAALPDMEGAALCRMLKSNPATAAIPILMLVDKGDRARRLSALRAGADEVLSPPIGETRLLSRVRSLLRAHEADRELRHRESTAREMGFAEPAATLLRPGRVALIGRTAEQAIGWKTNLRGHCPHTLVPMGRQQAMEIDTPGPVPDLFVVAAGLDGPEGGLRLVSELRSRSATRHAAILMVHPPRADEAQATALDIGANGLVEEGFDPEELALRIDRQIQRKRTADRLRNSVEDGLRLATVDPLTGLYNRRYGDHHLASLAQRAEVSGCCFAVLMLDIDRFKGVNDRYGHSAGDAVLRAVAQAIQGNLRAVDMVFRFGGEEFVVALPDASLVAARNAAERLRRVIADLVVTSGTDEPHRVTISIGLALGGPGGIPVAQTLDLADRALYRAKAEGRNRVCIAPTAAVATEPGARSSPVQGRGVLRGPLRSDLSSRSA